MKSATVFILVLTLGIIACNKKSGKSGDESAGMKETPMTPEPAKQPEMKPEPAKVQNADVKETPCDQAARLFQLSEGKKVLVHCPANCLEGSVWGTDFYTDDSAVCPALIHAGVLTAAGGHALVVYSPGMRAYRGSARHGITSTAYGKWERTFYGLKVNEAFLPASEPPAALDPDIIYTDCSFSPSSLELKNPDEKAIIDCPADCKTGSVWGTDVYTTDSNVCQAAIHAGLIKPATGGSFQVTILPGQEEYKGSERNGVTSEDYEKYETSFKVEAVPPPGGAPAAAPAPAPAPDKAPK